MRVHRWRSLIARKKPRSPSRIARRAGEPGAREIRGQHAVERRLAGMQMLAHRAVGVELPQPGGLRARAAERVEHRRRRAEQRSRCRGRAERRRRPGGMPEAVVARIHRFADAQRRVVAERHGEQKVAARRSAHVRPRRAPRESPAPPRERSSLCECRRAPECATRLRWRAPRRPPTIARREHRRLVGRSQPGDDSLHEPRGRSSEPAIADPSQSRIARCASSITPRGRSAKRVRDIVSARRRLTGSASSAGARSGEDIGAGSLRPREDRRIPNAVRPGARGR